MDVLVEIIPALLLLVCRICAYYKTEMTKHQQCNFIAATTSQGPKEATAKIMKGNRQHTGKEA